MGEEPGQIRREIEGTRSDLGETVEALSYKANVPARIKESVSEKTERLRGQMASTSSRVSEATPNASDVRDGAEQAVGIAQENPLGLMIGGVAVGFLVGLAMPKTQIEDERLGPIADDVKEMAKDSGQEALERGKQVAQDAASAATEAAKESGQQQVDGMRNSVKETVSESVPSEHSTSPASGGGP
jgi:gas vesicle protein